MSADHDHPLHTPPHSIEAEKAVLGACLLVSAAFDRIAGLIEENDFYRLDHRLIFRAISRMHGRGDAVDAITVGECLDHHNMTEDAGGPGYALGLASNSSGDANVEAYAQIVRDRSRLRTVIDVMTQGNHDAYNAGDGGADAVIEQALAKLIAMQVSDQTHDIGIREATKQAYQEIETAAKLPDGEFPGVPIGLAKFDRFLGGMHKQDLLIVGARPSVGKTALMTQIAVSAATAGYSVGVITAEQPATQIAMRMMAQSGRTSLHDMRNGSVSDSEWPKIATGMNKIVGLPIRMWDRPAPDISEVFAQAREWDRIGELDLLLVDFIQLMTARGYENKAYEIGAIAKGLKRIGRELDIPVVALSQLKRSIDDKGHLYVPVLSDLGESGGIETAADTVVFVVRPEVIKPGEQPGVARFAIRKNKHGPITIIKFSWIGYCIRFEELAPEPPYQQEFQ